MIVAFGDSLSAAPDAWPGYLGEPVEVVARVGARIADVPGQLDGAPDGDVAVVSVGTNDVLRLDEPLQPKLLLPVLDVIVERYRRVALVGVMLTRCGHHGYWPALEPRRAAMRAILYASGLPVVAPRLAPWCWHLDGIHPNRLGHRKIAAQVAAFAVRAPAAGS